MDSTANSGSMQSSSGGDDDYDARAAVDSSFITTTFSPFSPPPPPPPHTQTIYNNHPYNYNININSSNFLNQQSQTISFPLHPHHFTPTTAASSPSPQPLDHQDQTVQVARNPKKRSRATRRAPTTVLTTDTSNFRAMVQEFTGIPPSPLLSSSLSNTHVINLRNKLQFSHQTPLLKPQKLPPQSYNYNNMLNNYTNNNNNNNNILSSQLLSNTCQLFQNPNICSLQSLSNNVGKEHGQCNNAQVTGGLPELISPENGNNYKYNSIASATIFEQTAKRMRESLSATRGTNYIVTSEAVMEPWMCSSD